MKYSVKNASVTIGAETILDYVNFEIKDADHIGIVGRNGAGKTTLLRALIDNDMFEEGIEDEKFEIIRHGNFSIGYQSQISFDDEETSLIDEIKKSFKDIMILESRMAKLMTQMEKDQSEDVIREYTEALDRFEIEGGYTYKKEYQTMIRKFGFKEEDTNRPIKSFSGGEKTKIAFMKLLLSKPDILFLDEPTNHLDIEAIEWLEDYLKNYKGAFVIVSHDRMFLNNTVNTIYDISHGKVTKYIGDYESYEKQKEENYERDLYNYEKQQSEIKRLYDLYLRFRNKPSKAAMALSKLHMIEKMVKLEKPERIDKRVFRTNLDKMEESVKKVLSCRNVEIGYDHPLGHLNLEIFKGQKVGIIGSNGTGKSTLIKTIRGEIEPLRGSITYGERVRVGYFDQNLAMTDSENTVLEEFTRVHPELLTEEARSALGSFMFRGEDVYKKVSVLSGGEKVRLTLCKILYDKPNFLILDEPTNHMDILGKKHLEDILKMYKGTILFVSHDRYFIKKIATQILEFDRGEIKYYPFGYDYYVEKKKENSDIVEAELEIIKESLQEKSEKVPKKVNTYNVKRELKIVEEKIIELEGKIAKLSEELNDPNVYSDYEKARNINDSLKDAQSELDSQNEVWENLTNELLDRGN